MLVLSRKKNESIVINGNIRIEVLQIKGKQIRLGITAPNSMKVLRGELPSNEERFKDSMSDEKPTSSTTVQSKREVDSPRPESEPSSMETTVIECDLHSLVSAVMANA